MIGSRYHLSHSPNTGRGRNMKNCVASFLMASACLALAACGGGSSGGGNSGGGGGGGTAVNRAPTFTNASDVSFVESTTSVDTRTVVQLTASDADGDALTFDFVAGKDAALFSFFNTAGAIAFNEPVSFETPRDANGDNVYEVDVSVSDGTATTRQTISITITNDRENLLITELASGLGRNAQVQYIDATNELLIVSRDGQVSIVDAQTGAVTNHGIYGGGAIEVLDIVDDGSFVGNGRFFVLERTGPEIDLAYVDISDLSSRLIWRNTNGSQFGTLGLRGSGVLVAFDEAGDGAQFPATPSGRITEFQFFGNGVDRFATVNLIPRGWGLRNPRLLTSSNVQGFVIDQGLEFSEINQAEFELSQSDANFEWPYRDGFEERQAPPTNVQGTFVAPRVVQEVDVDGAGRWIDASDSLQGDTWFGVFVISDTRGNIWTWDRNNDGPLENRNLDFWGDTPDADRPRIVSMDDGDFDVGNAIPIYMIDSLGTLYRVDLNP